MYVFTSSYSCNAKASEIWPCLAMLRACYTASHRASEVLAGDSRSTKTVATNSSIVFMLNWKANRNGQDLSSPKV